LEEEAHERVATIVAADVGVVGNHVYVVALVWARPKAVDDRVAVWWATCTTLAPEGADTTTIVIAGDAVVGAAGDGVVNCIISRAWRWQIVIDKQLGRVIQVAKLATIVDVEGDGRVGVLGQAQSAGAVDSHVKGLIARGLKNEGGWRRIEGRGDG
jgi:hypothetical protein